MYHPERHIFDPLIACGPVEPRNTPYAATAREHAELLREYVRSEVLLQRAVVSPFETLSLSLLKLRGHFTGRQT